MNAGVTVHMISISVPWLKLDATKLMFWLKNQIVLNNIQDTKIKIAHKKNIKSWCKLIIPSIIGVAGS